MTKADRFTSQDRKTQVYSDFLTNFNAHPESKDITRFVNEHAVIRSIKNLMLTNRGERLFQPKLGSDITRLLFEPMGPSTANILSNTIQDTITQHEPRAKVLQVDVVPNYDKNLYSVNIAILVINKQQPTTFNVLLTRVR